MSYTWNVSLSDGRRVSMKDLAKPDVNPWHELVHYVKGAVDVNGAPIRITHLELLVNSIRYNSPSHGKNTLFKSSTEPKYFWILGVSEALMSEQGNGTTDYIGFSYRIGDFRHIKWVNLESNFNYDQVLNVVNPSTLEEKEFLSVEKHLVSLWGG